MTPEPAIPAEWFAAADWTVTEVMHVIDGALDADVSR